MFYFIVVKPIREWHFNVRRLDSWVPTRENEGRSFTLMSTFLRVLRFLSFY